jgi:hypothetical protein
MSYTQDVYTFFFLILVGSISSTPRRVVVVQLIKKISNTISDSDSEYQQRRQPYVESSTSIRLTAPNKQEEPHPHWKQDMTTTEYQRCTDPNKQLGPYTHTYKEPPATVHGDNRAHV